MEKASQGSSLNTKYEFHNMSADNYISCDIYFEMIRTKIIIVSLMCLCRVTSLQKNI